MSANTLGRYHIIREIARSNDIVYEAMDPASGQKIALKELSIPSNLVGQARQERIQRFTREARAAAGLKHTNIVRILDHGQIQSRYYIAMEYLQGGSLRDLLRGRGSLPLAEALRIAAGVADGLEFAHRHGVVHRDVKPDNVHLEPDGRVVITDFGIARLTFEPTLTADGQIFGTPSYMSPEQVTGKGIDSRSDLFSLGVMLYEMIAGRKPFTGDSVITITYNIMNMEPPPVAGAPSGVDLIIRKAMSKEPGRRYGSAAEMAEDLRRVAQGAPPKYATAVPPPRARPSPAPVRAAPIPAAPRGPAPAPAAGYGRPLPQPMFGGPPPAPGNGGRAPSYGPPAPSPHGYPPSGHPGVAPAPNGFAPPGYTRSPPRASGGSEWKWLLGWLGVAVIIGAITVSIVWATVTANDRFQADRQLIDLQGVLAKAEKASNEGRLKEAFDRYLEAANASSGAPRELAKKNAAVMAVRLAQERLDKRNGSEAEAFCNQALQLDPDYPLALVELGRARVLQGRVDEGVAAFDQVAAAASARQRSGVPPAEAQSAREAALLAPEWKAEALYSDGVKLLPKDPAAAQQRFEEVVKTAPKSGFATNAKIQLSRLGALPASPGGSGSPALPGVPGAALPDAKDYPDWQPPNFTPPG